MKEILSLNQMALTNGEIYRKDKSELDEQLVKDKYTLDAMQSENRELQDAKVHLENEKEQLYTKLRS